MSFENTMAHDDAAKQLLLGTKRRGERPSDNGDTGTTCWCIINKVIDVKEAKAQVLFSLPMILTGVCYYLIPLVSVMFAGHLGELQLAGSTLANSWANVSGFAFMIGLSGALETLCGQGYGAKLYDQLGLYLQASCIISFFFSIIISIIWWYTEPILLLLQQSPDISKQAAIYMRCLIPGVFAFGTLQNILRFLQTQSVVLPLVICSLVPLLSHLGIVYVLVHYTSLGYKGAPVATSIAFWISAIMLLAYVKFDKKFELTWRGFKKESFRYVFPGLKLALPSAAMVFLEFMAFEVLVLLAGIMPNSKTTTSLIATCVNTEDINYNIVYGLSAAASTRVSNELGAGRPNKAKHAMGVTLKLSILTGAAIIIVLGFAHNVWAGFFTDNIEIIQAFASITPLICISTLLDSIQAVFSGTIRGCGWQHLATYGGLGTFYLFGMPIACVLAFKFQLYVQGLWTGLNCGIAANAGALLLVILLQDWTTFELPSSAKENFVIV